MCIDARTMVSAETMVSASLHKATSVSKYSMAVLRLSHLDVDRRSRRQLKLGHSFMSSLNLSSVAWCSSGEFHTTKTFNSPGYR